MKQKLFSMLALLLMAATGAVAQTETLLTTITPTGDASYSETTTGVATVKLSNVGYYDEDDGYGWVWFGSGSVTVEAKEGYTITRCVFTQNEKTPVTITTSPFAITFNESGYCEQDLYVAMNGATSIEVYGYAPASSTYIVAGNNAEILGSIWDGSYEANKMTKGGDGKYTKTYNVEDAFDDIQLKVVKDGQDWIGDKTGNNVTFSMKQAGSFTVTLDPNANPVCVTITGDNVVFANTEYAINYATGMQNGTVTGPNTAKEDDEVTLTITPAAGYVLESISVTGVTTENAVEVTDGKFTMPAEDVNVIATFKLVTYTVTLAEGTEDAGNWDVPTEAAEGSPVTITYNGEKKVKSVKAVKKAVAITDLATITADYEAKDGETLTGTLASNVKISIADGATVTLKDVNINGSGTWTSGDYAGITCAGDATIILSGTNTVNGFYEDYPGIQAAADKTLTINGTGSLTASSYGYGAGIGGGLGISCGNIEIQGGTITATSNQYSAGIGGGENASCGNITISGGTVNATGGTHGAGIGGGNNASWGNITISGGTVTATGGERGAGIGGGRKGSTGSVSSGNILISGGTVTATGGEYAAGIGGGRGYNDGTFSSCGTITITTGVTKVTATMGDGATNSIGAGKYCNCGTVTIGGNVGAITTSPYTYQP